MATSAGSLYATGPLAGCDFTKKRSSSLGPEFPVKMRVPLNNGKIAMYVIAGAAITVSASCGGADASGTTSSSAGPYISMNDATLSAGEYFWVRTSGDQVLP